jgi:hypothetical protein
MTLYAVTPEEAEAARIRHEFKLLERQPTPERSA